MRYAASLCSTNRQDADSELAVVIRARLPDDIIRTIGSSGMQHKFSEYIYEVYDGLTPPPTRDAKPWALISFGDRLRRT